MDALLSSVSQVYNRRLQLRLALKGMWYDCNQTTKVCFKAQDFLIPYSYDVQHHVKVGNSYAEPKSSEHNYCVPIIDEHGKTKCVLNPWKKGDDSDGKWANHLPKQR